MIKVYSLFFIKHDDEYHVTETLYEKQSRSSRLHIILDTM